jgi:hypothetical protein
MSKIKFLVMFLVVAGMGLSSCKKEEAATPAADKKTLLSKTWKISEYYEDGQLIQDPVLTSARMTFNAAGTYSSIFDGDTDNGTWAFNAAEDRIILDGGTVFEETWSIQELTTSRLKVSYTDAGSSYEIIYVPA